MQEGIATAQAHPNIAFIKYWGNRDDALRLPASGSISMNLDGLATITTVRFSSDYQTDRFVLNGQPQSGESLQRVSTHLDVLRNHAGVSAPAEVISENNFPTGTGIASSASAFAALTVSAAAALGLSLKESEMSAVARLGSGSASRSVLGGFVEWYAGEDHPSSYAQTIAPVEHWNLVDIVAVVSSQHKAVGSTGGHALASTSIFQAPRIADAPRRITICREAILKRDFETFAAIVEMDALMMHGVMMTSTPQLVYWLPPTLSVMHSVMAWRQQGIAACFTIDAGPNVHVITTHDSADFVRGQIAEVDGIERVLVAPVGGPAKLLDWHLSA